MSEQRLHPAGIAIGAASGLRGLLLPVLAAVVLSRGSGGGLMVGLLGLGVAVALGVWRWTNTTYAIDAGAIRFRTGLLDIKERTIPIDRLQSVDASQGPLQKLFGVQQLKLQAAGSGEESEIVLNALGAGQVEELLALFGRPDEARGPERRLSARALALAGLTSAQFGFLIPVLAAGAQSFDDIADPLFGRQRGDAPPHAVGPFLIAAAAVIFAAWIVAFTSTVIAFAGFTVERRGDRLVVQRGLLVRRESSLPVARVQAVRLVDGLLRQPLGLTQLRVETAGYSDEHAYAQTLFPLLRRRAVEGFLGDLLPELATPIDASLRPPPARAGRRYLTLPVAATIAVAVPVAVVIGDALPLLVVAAGVGYGIARYRAAGWSYDGARLVVRERRIARQTVVARRSSVDIRTLSQNPFQRRARLATMRFAIASKRRFGIAHVELGDAAAALADLASPTPGPPSRAAS
jgi:putative membrane protein